MAEPILITGPQAAGKSTVARQLAESFERGVHVEGDVFRRFIASGRVEMTPDAPDEAFAQLRLRYRLAAMVAREYAEAGFDVVVEDVVAGPMLEEVVELLAIRPDSVFVLMPSRQAITVREAGRSAKGYGRWSIDQLYDLFQSGTPRIGHWLDTSDLTPDEVVAMIRRACRG